MPRRGQRVTVGAHRGRTPAWLQRQISGGRKIPRPAAEPQAPAFRPVTLRVPRSDSLAASR